MSALVSIIVPIYNVEKYLHECIDSVLSQSYENIEVILVDDGSPDSCPKICDEYARIDSRVVAVHRQNGGLSSARNAGISIANGCYIMFVDSDDFIDCNMVEVMVKYLEDSGADVVSCSSRNVDEVSRPMPTFYENEKEHGTFDNVTAIRYILTRKCGIAAWSKIHRREVIEQIPFIEGRLNEDIIYYFEVYQKCNKISYVTDVLYNYRQRETSTTGKFGKCDYDMILNMEEMCSSSYIAEKCLESEALFYKCWASIQYCRNMIISRMRDKKSQSYYSRAIKYVSQNLLYILSSGDFGLKMILWAFISELYRVSLNKE